MKENKGKVFHLKTKKRKSMKKRHIIVSIMAAYLVIFLSFQAFQVISLKKQEKMLNEQVKLLEQEKAKYQEQLQEINSPQHIEKVARENLRMIKPNEILYVVPESIEETILNEEETEEEE